MASMMLKSSSQLVASRSVRVSNARSVVVAKAGSREMWYPGATAPPHLNGTLAGDYGFDPLRLGDNPEALKWFVEAEKTNGRWAMAAVVGILFTDLVNLPKFWLAGAETYPIDNKTLTIIEIAVFAVLEGLRYNGWKQTGKSGAFTSYPFDPMGMASKETEIKEVKNGRLAMLAFVGFCSQAAVRGKGPIECLTDHIADPGHNNIFTSVVGKESVVTVAVLCVWPMIIEATKRKGVTNNTPWVFPWVEPWNKVQ